jgi:hypothetical protein
MHDMMQTPEHTPINLIKRRTSMQACGFRSCLYFSRYATPLPTVCVAAKKKKRRVFDSANLFFCLHFIALKDAPGSIPASLMSGPARSVTCGFPEELSHEKIILTFPYFLAPVTSGFPGQQTQGFQSNGQHGPSPSPCCGLVCNAYMCAVTCP